MWKGILDAFREIFGKKVGDEKFNETFGAGGAGGLKVMANGSTDVPTKPVDPKKGQAGDIGRVKNPDASKPGWQNENVVRTDDGPLTDKSKVVGHGLKSDTIGGVKKELDGLEKKGKKRAAETGKKTGRVSADVVNDVR